MKFMKSTENCAKCGNKLLWHEERMAFWNKQLKDGYIKWMVIGHEQFGKKKEFPEWAGKKLCERCVYLVFTGVVPWEEDEDEPKSPVKPVVVGEDFADLKEALVKSGVVMQAFKCPKCDGMNDIPTSGRLLICKHCGAPIKPAEIYEKIKQML
jgi:hypothetical protein